MAIAQKISKRTTIRKQTGLGVPGSATGQVLRRTSSVFSAIRDTFPSNEVQTHHQSTGVSYGLKRAEGTVEGELSPGTYQLFMESILEADAAAVNAYNSGTDTTPNVAGTFTDASGGFLTAGLKVGMVGRWTGFTSTAAGNNGKNFWITGLTATVMTGIFLNGDAVVTATAGDDATFTPVGKFISPPLTGHTKNYLQIEEYYSDLTDSDLFTDCVVGSVDVSLPATGNATLSAGLVGLSRTLSGSQVMAAPTAETDTPIMTAVNGALYINGVSTPVTGLTINISNNAAPTSAEVGSNSAGDVSRSTINVSGQFMAMLRDQTLSALYDAETDVSIICVVTGDETDQADFVAFSLGQVKITGDSPDDNDAIMRTYPFTAQIYRAGGSGTAWNETILTVQDSDFA
jgi:hypothetical protein